MNELKLYIPYFKKNLFTKKFSEGRVISKFHFLRLARNFEGELIRYLRNFLKRNILECIKIIIPYIIVFKVSLKLKENPPSKALIKWNLYLNINLRNLRYKENILNSLKF